MKKTIISVATLTLFALPLVASAHQHASYDIGGVQYDIVIGSLNEPVVVDDKTGLDLRVTSEGKMTVAADGDMEATGGKPATGLENSLKVEMLAGGVKKTFDISPVYNAPGSYKTTFYPTVATSFAYRIFGTVNDTPVDITFPCLEAGSTATDEGEKQISAGVKQLIKGGGFGCPLPKDELGFPKKGSTIADVSDTTGSSRTFGIVGIALGAVAIALSARRRA